MKTFHATSLDLRHYVTSTYVYSPKNIVVDAIQITTENVGGLCLEYEADMMWDHELGAHFAIWAERNEGAPVSLLLRPGFWLVPLRGEIHRFDDYTFENTFVDTSTLNSEGEPYDVFRPMDLKTEEALREYAKKDAKATEWLTQEARETVRAFPYQQPVVRFEVTQEKMDDLIAKSSIGEGAQPPTPEEMEHIALRQYAEERGIHVNLNAFKKNDRVRVVSTTRLGTVMGWAEQGQKLVVEATMDADGLIYQFLPEQLQKLDGKDELRKLREKLMQDPDTTSMTEQVEWENEPVVPKFVPNDRVTIEGVRSLGTVTVAQNEAGKVEVLLDDGSKAVKYDETYVHHAYSENPVDPKNLFKTEDRVRVVGTEDYATVVDPLADGGVEVLLDNTGQTYTFHANKLERVYPEIGTDQVKD